jgi:hypothetical protein
MENYYEGITSSVLSNPSRILVEDVLNEISHLKTSAAMDWITSLDVEIENSIILGTYLTGAALAEELNEISDVTVVDIHPHLRGLLTESSREDPNTGVSEILSSETLQPSLPGRTIRFHGIRFHPYSESVSELLKAADMVVDTTGLGGLKPEMARKIHADVFLVEDPCSDGSDTSIKDMNMTTERIRVSKSTKKGILKTGGLNAKTSGTMTLTIQVILKSLENLLKEEGVLYGVASMDFYEGVLFHEKNLQRFQDLIKKPALTISSMAPVSVDAEIQANLNKIESMVEDVSI